MKAIEWANFPWLLTGNHLPIVVSWRSQRQRNFTTSLLSHMTALRPIQSLFGLTVDQDVHPCLVLCKKMVHASSMTVKISLLITLRLGIRELTFSGLRVQLESAGQLQELRKIFRPMMLSNLKMHSRPSTLSTRSSLSIRRISSSFLVRVMLESMSHTYHGRFTRITCRLNSDQT